MSKKYRNLTWESTQSLRGSRFRPVKSASEMCVVSASDGQDGRDGRDPLAYVLSGMKKIEWKLGRDHQDGRDGRDPWAYVLSRMKDIEWKLGRDGRDS